MKSFTNFALGIFGLGEMTFEEIRKEIKAGRYKPVYFFCGEEPFFIDRLTALLENGVLTEEEKAFNLTVIYGNDTTMSTVADTARRFPMMAERQVVIVREAQNIKDFDNLLPYLDHIQPSTILVLAYKNKKPDKRKGVFRKLGNSGDCVYFESAKLYDNKVPEWIIGYCKEKSYGITTKAAGMLAESLGTDLNRVANEIDKLGLLLPKGGEITETLVEEHTGISKDFNSFELLNAIVYRDFLKANRIVNYFEANPKNNPIVLTITALFRYFLNLLTYHYQKKSTPNVQEMAKLLGVHPFFMKDYTDGARVYTAMKCAQVISLLREYDLKSKGVGNAGSSDGELLKELVFKIMH